ncbi:hypothetical protein FCOIX_5970 [Fusarium coicis]|nr:hypothetical protein FCOIX_5970 [Fusarium coicis]
MPSTPEAGVRITLYQAPSDPHDILRAQVEIIAKSKARIVQLNADKEDLQARLTKRDNDADVLKNVIGDQAIIIRDLNSKIGRQGKQTQDLKYKRHAQVSKQERELKDEGRENEDLETHPVIFQRFIDEDNISASSGSSGTDYDLMVLSSDEEEEEQDIDPDSDISFTTDSNSLDNFGAANIESEKGKAMNYS